MILGFLVNRLTISLAGALISASLVVGAVSYVAGIEKTSKFTQSVIRLTGNGTGIIVPSAGEFPAGYVEARAIAEKTAEGYDPKQRSYSPNQ